MRGPRNRRLCSVAQIAEEIGCYPSSVRKALRRLEVKAAATSGTGARLYDLDEVIAAIDRRKADRAR